MNTNAVSWIRPQTNEKFNFFCLLCCSSSAPKFSRYRSDLSLESRAENDNYDDPTIESITESDFSTESSNLAAQDLNGIDLNVGLIDFNEKIVNQSLAEKVIEENIGQPVLMNIDLRKQLHKANEFNSFQDQLQTTKVREQNQTHDKNRVENFIDGLIRVIDLRFQNRLPAEPRIDSHKTNDENEPLKYDSNLELTSMIDNLNYLNESEILNLYNGTIDIITVTPDSVGNSASFDSSQMINLTLSTKLDAVDVNFNTSKIDTLKKNVTSSSNNWKVISRNHSPNLATDNGGVDGVIDPGPFDNRTFDHLNQTEPSLEKRARHDLNSEKPISSLIPSFSNTKLHFIPFGSGDVINLFPGSLTKPNSSFSIRVPQIRKPQMGQNSAHQHLSMI